MANLALINSFFIAIPQSQWIGFICTAGKKPSGDRNIQLEPTFLLSPVFRIESLGHIVQCMGQPPFLVKIQTVNILSFTVHMTSVATT